MVFKQDPTYDGMRLGRLEQGLAGRQYVTQREAHSSKRYRSWLR